jgi:hypothetical protein
MARHFKARQERQQYVEVDGIGHRLMASIAGMQAIA